MYICVESKQMMGQWWMWFDETLWLAIGRWMLVLVPKVSSSNQVTVRYEGDTHWSRNRISLVIYTQTETNLVQNSKQTNTMCIKAIDSISEEVWNDCTDFTSPFSLPIYTLWILAQLPNWRQASSLVMLPVAWKSKPRNKARVAVKPFLTWVPLRGRTVSVLRVIIYINIHTKSKEFRKYLSHKKAPKRHGCSENFLVTQNGWLPLILPKITSPNLQSGCIQPTTPFRKLRWNPNMVVWKITFNSIGWSLGFSWFFLD